MHLRKLEQKDAIFMLEWMHDDFVVHDLSTNFATKKLADCEHFIASAQNSLTDMHLAVVSDDDVYMGTVSLKHIDKETLNAEFAITVRSCAMGIGYSWYAMAEIIRVAYDDLGLNCIYWCVSKHNKRAVRFYDKHGFHETVELSNQIKDRYKGVENLKWYASLKGDDYRNATQMHDMIAGCRIINIKTMVTMDAGELSFIETKRDIPFEIKRIYYITKVPQGARRGFHAHKKLKQLLFCPYGKICLLLDNGKKREEFTLSDPSIGVLIEQTVWREMQWLEKDSVLCVAVSDYYDSDDYIRDYKRFTAYINETG